MDSYVVKWMIQGLERSGWYDMANLPLAVEYLKVLKRVPSLKGVRMLHGTGEYGVGQTFYMPKYRKRLLTHLKYLVKDADQMRNIRAKALAKFLARENELAEK